MVFYGTPSRGCDHCRKTKKRCGLEVPACQRCVKQGRVCSGYRDMTQLMIRDQTDMVRKKVERQKAKPTVSSPLVRSASQVVAPPFAERRLTVTTSDALPFEPSKGQSCERFMRFEPMQVALGLGAVYCSANRSADLQADPDDVAVNYFLQQFTSDYHWDFIRNLAREPSSYPCLNLAIRACGMAALANARSATRGREFARLRYVNALALLNQALRDPKASTSDESLIAVRMLGFYENITCDPQQSIRSWQAHIDGAAQILRLRGKAQFKTDVGRAMFREVRRLISAYCIWNYREEPSFLNDYQLDLDSQTPESCRGMFEAVDQMSMLSSHFAKLRSQISAGMISNVDAEVQALEIEQWLEDWSKESRDRSAFWRYEVIEVSDNEHVWDGRSALYSGHLTPEIWNTWRCTRIMVSRMQEMLYRRLSVPEWKRESQIRRLQALRRQMADDICASIPACLGHHKFSSESSCVLTTAQGAIWPLFFAATCALERVGESALPLLRGAPTPPALMHSAAYAQTTWILGRLNYIADYLGLKWASGATTPLRGQFKVQQDALNEAPIESWMSQVTTADRSPWLHKIEEQHRSQQMPIRNPSFLVDV